MGIRLLIPIVSGTTDDRDEKNGKRVFSFSFLVKEKRRRRRNN